MGKPWSNFSALSALLSPFASSGVATDVHSPSASEAATPESVHIGEDDGRDLLTGDVFCGEDVRETNPARRVVRARRVVEHIKLPASKILEALSQAPT